MRIALMFALALAAASAVAQAPAVAPATPASDDGPAIEDNSFLIEEAYNQDPRTVQHIFTYTRLRDGSWAASFTQEWPLGGQKHQGSYSLVTDRRSLAGAEINYRYQLYGGDN